jgi:hypothetical protein
MCCQCRVDVRPDGRDLAARNRHIGLAVDVVERVDGMAVLQQQIIRGFCHAVYTP